MSKKVDTFENVDNKIIAIGNSSTSPSNLKKKGINKMELTEKVPNEININWLTQGVRPDECVIDDDYSLDRITLQAFVKSKTVYTNQQGGGIGLEDPIMNAIQVEVIGGKPPYTYSWSVPAGVIMLNGQYTYNLGVDMIMGPYRYEPFICTVRDSLNNVAYGSGYINIIRIPSNQTPPPDIEDPVQIPPENPLLVEIRDPKYSYRILENFEVLGDGSPIEIEFMADVEGGIKDYTYEWKIGSQIISTHYKPTITIPNYGVHRVVLTVTDAGGNQGGDGVYVTYLGDHFIGCAGDYQHRGGQGIHEMTIDYGTATGMCGVWFDMDNVPDALEIWWDGIRVASTPGLVSGKGTLTFNKLDPTPTTATIVVKAEELGTAWELKGICP